MGDVALVDLERFAHIPPVLKEAQKRSMMRREEMNVRYMRSYGEVSVKEQYIDEKDTPAC